MNVQRVAAGVQWVVLSDGARGMTVVSANADVSSEMPYTAHVLAMRASS
jgi:hypothetical protein